MICTLQPQWEFVSDSVMGGVSTGALRQEKVAGRPATRLTGRVSLDNGGGFLQMAFDLRRDGTAMDVSRFAGFEVELFGNGETCDLRVRTTQLLRAWQSFRAPLKSTLSWQTLFVPFERLQPHKTEADFDPRELRRIGIVAVGREMQVDLSVSGVRLVD
ncbi:MAG: CIA30 family protein [Pseudomonadota bacterium]